MTIGHNEQPSASTSAVIVVKARNGFTLPPEALPVLRDSSDVYVTSELPSEIFATTPVADPEKIATASTVLITSSVQDPIAAQLIFAGARVIDSPSTVGDVLAEAVEVMDRLRSPGGCPWDAVQTHASIRKYLVEETYELLDAIDSGDRLALREELGDVLLQVLFHARVAEEHDTEPFGIGEVSQDLITKLVRRHAYVFADGEVSDTTQQQVRSAEQQRENWEQSKSREKQRGSIMDGVALGQPATALAGKLGQRSGRAGIPLDLLPTSDDADARQLFRIAAVMRRADQEPELELRSVAVRFAEDIRNAETNARHAGLEPATLQADDWRRFWPVNSASHNP